MNSLCTDRTQALTVVSVILTVIATLQLHYTTWQMCPNLDLTYVTNQTPCPNGLTHHSGPKSPLAVRICPFCPRPNGRNLTTSVRIWSLTLVPIFRGPETTHGVAIAEIFKELGLNKSDNKRLRLCVLRTQYLYVYRVRTDQYVRGITILHIVCIVL